MPHGRPFQEDFNGRTDVLMFAREDQYRKLASLLETDYSELGEELTAMLDEME